MNNKDVLATQAHVADQRLDIMTSAVGN